MNTSFVNGTGRLVQNGFNMRLSGDVVYVLAPGFIDYSMTGSTHGSPQSYDTHVPLLMFGFGIKKGTTAARVEVVDIAPTIATILKIAFPNGCTGNPIQAALQN
jgi:predicted AlkP superfamily pyrophosphatase or phosphodiesterase